MNSGILFKLTFLLSVVVHLNFCISLLNDKRNYLTSAEKTQLSILLDRINKVGITLYYFISSSIEETKSDYQISTPSKGDQVEELMGKLKDLIEGNKNVVVAVLFLRSSSQSSFYLGRSVAKVISQQRFQKIINETEVSIENEDNLVKSLTSLALFVEKLVEDHSPWLMVSFFLIFSVVLFIIIVGTVCCIKKKSDEENGNLSAELGPDEILDQLKFSETLSTHLIKETQSEIKERRDKEAKEIIKAN